MITETTIDVRYPDCDPDPAALLCPPGVDPATLPANEARYNGQTATVAATYPHVPAEPPLASYARP